MVVYHSNYYKVILESLIMNYSDIYEYLRKEKNGDALQELPKEFVPQFSNYLTEKRKQFSQKDEFSIEIAKDRKQFENALTLFKELILRRKKKILNLVFVVSETGIMKRDFTNMLSFEKDLFEKIVEAVDSNDKKLNEMLNGKNGKNGESIFANERIEQFVDMDGNLIGPFEKDQLVSIDKNVAEILVSSGKARFVD